MANKPALVTLTDNKNLRQEVMLTMPAPALRMDLKEQHVERETQELGAGVSRTPQHHVIRFNAFATWPWGQDVIRGHLTSVVFVPQTPNSSLVV